ncbi:DUF5677 domain-containing protein [Actinosynnema sp. NPDC020468]|uniref:DUF5677 domain-containing protein n=1 Tax=Actinosynnema sp. NPDC020468 TaxID=3154488 RepID=UPI0033C1D715
MSIMEMSRSLISWSILRCEEVSKKLFENVDYLNPAILRTAMSSFPKRQRYYIKRYLHNTFTVASLLQNSAIDHARAIEHLLSGSAVTVWAPLSLTRVVIESSVRARYLIDPEAPAAEIVLRGAAALLDGLQEQKSLSSQFDVSVQATVSVALEKVEKDIARAGLRVERFNGKLKYVYWPNAGRKEPCKPSVTDLAKKWISHSPGIYGITSGAVHGGYWLSGASISPDGSTFRSDPENIVLCALAVAFSLRLVVLAVHEIHCVDADEYRISIDCKAKELLDHFIQWKEYMKSGSAH